jgi:outer membrane immunogenic protein
MRWRGVSFVTAALLLAASQAASAAPPVPYNWTGFYVGAHAGYGWDTESAAIQSSTLVLSGLFGNGTIPSALGVDPKGPLGGVQLGYNYQINRIVLGVEADVSLADMQGDVSVTNPGPVLPFASYTTSVEQRMRWFGTLRGRLGFAATDNLLIYGTGGLAYGETEFSANIHRSAILIKFDVPASTKDTRTGWTIGGGVEWALARNWSVKGEYLYYDLGDTTITGNVTLFGIVTAATANYSFATRGNIARIGINYRFF